MSLDPSPVIAPTARVHPDARITPRPRLGALRGLERRHLRRAGRAGERVLLDGAPCAGARPAASQPGSAAVREVFGLPARGQTPVRGPPRRAGLWCPRREHSKAGLPITISVEI